MNLLVETFLEERNVSHLLSDWRDLNVQRQVLQQVTCLCTRDTNDGNVRCTSPLLSIAYGDQKVRVRSSTEVVFLGRDCAGINVPHAMTYDHLFVNDALVHDLHCMIKRVAAGKYLLSTFTLTHTWLQIGARGAVLLPGAAFLAGCHVFQVLQSPLVRERHKHLACVSTVVPLPFARDDSIEDEIPEVEQTPCILECVAPPFSAIFGKTWAIPYERGNAKFVIGADVNSSAVLPTFDTLAAAQHCVVQAYLGYFWLVPCQTTYYQLYPSSRSVAICAETTPLRILLGGATQLTLAIS